MYDIANLTVKSVESAQWTSIVTKFSDCTYEQVYEYSCAAAKKIGAAAYFLDIACGDDAARRGQRPLEDDPVSRPWYCLCFRGAPDTRAVRIIRGMKHVCEPFSAR